MSCRETTSSGVGALIVSVSIFYVWGDLSFIPFVSKVLLSVPEQFEKPSFSSDIDVGTITSIAIEVSMKDVPGVLFASDLDFLQAGCRE